MIPPFHFAPHLSSKYTHLLLFYAFRVCIAWGLSAFQARRVCQLFVSAGPTDKEYGVLQSQSRISRPQRIRRCVGFCGLHVFGCAGFRDWSRSGSLQGQGRHVFGCLAGMELERPPCCARGCTPPRLSVSSVVWVSPRKPSRSSGRCAWLSGRPRMFFRLALYRDLPRLLYSACFSAWHFPAICPMLFGQGCCTVHVFPLSSFPRFASRRGFAGSGPLRKS